MGGGLVGGVGSGWVMSGQGGGGPGCGGGFGGWRVVGGWVEGACRGVVDNGEAAGQWLVFMLVVLT